MAAAKAFGSYGIVADAGVDVKVDVGVPHPFVAEPPTI